MPNLENPDCVRPSFDARRLGSMLRDVTHDVAGHGLAWCAWNGNPCAGWTFYCPCGYCTPMKRSFEDGLNLLENHWQFRLTLILGAVDALDAQLHVEAQLESIPGLEDGWQLEVTRADAEPTHEQRDPTLGERKMPYGPDKR